MPQNVFFLTNSRPSGQPENHTKTLFSHLPSPFPGNFWTATVVAFVLLCNSRFSFHCYTQCDATPTQKSVRKWRCDLSRHLAQKITKGLHSCKPALLNHPIHSIDVLMVIAASAYKLHQYLYDHSGAWHQRHQPIQCQYLYGHGGIKGINLYSVNIYMIMVAPKVSTYIERQYSSDHGGTKGINLYNVNIYMIMVASKASTYTQHQYLDDHGGINMLLPHFLHPLHELLHSAGIQSVGPVATLLHRRPHNHCVSNPVLVIILCCQPWPHQNWQLCILKHCCNRPTKQRVKRKMKCKHAIEHKETKLNKCTDFFEWLNKNKETKRLKND